MKRKLLSIFMCMLLAAGMLAGCGGSETSDVSDTAEAEDADETAEDLEAATVADMEALTVEYKSSDEYPDWEKEKYTTIALNSGSADITGSGATADGAYITITEAGYYVLSGELTDGNITIEAPGTDDKVYLIFNGAAVTCSDGAAIVENSADKVIISLVDGTENYITGGTQTDDTQTDAEDSDNADDEPTAAVYCEDSLTINGTGTLTVTGNFNDGITSRATLKIMEGTVNVTSADDGIVGKNRVIIKDGNVNVTAAGDGIKATKTSNTDKGIIYIEGGSVAIDAGADGMQAENIIKITGGTFDIVTGGSSDVDSSTAAEITAKPIETLTAGNDASETETSGAYRGDFENGDMQNGGMQGGRQNGNMQGGDMQNGNRQNGGWGSWENENTQDDSAQSAKALKATAGIYISGGTFNIDSSDDAVHTNGNAYICGGALEISSGDDGMHADSDMQIAGGTINITKSYEGIEGANIIISGGDISLVASDDGLNAAGGNDGSSIDGRMGMNSFEESGDYTIDISGGSINVNAAGDGVDSNGAIYMSGGTLIVSGPLDSGNGILDYGSEFAMSGGTLLCSGTSGMFQTISTSSTQKCINYSGSSYAAGTEIALYGGDSLIVSYTAAKTFNTIIISTPDLVEGNEYTLLIGDDSQTVTATAGADYNGMGGF